MYTHVSSSSIRFPCLDETPFVWSSLLKEAQVKRVFSRAGSLWAGFNSPQKSSSKVKDLGKGMAMQLGLMFTLALAADLCLLTMFAMLKPEYQRLSMGWFEKNFSDLVPVFFLFLRGRIPFVGSTCCSSEVCHCLQLLGWLGLQILGPHVFGLGTAAWQNVNGLSIGFSRVAGQRLWLYNLRFCGVAGQPLGYLEPIFAIQTVAKSPNMIQHVFLWWKVRLLGLLRWIQPHWCLGFAPLQTRAMGVCGVCLKCGCSWLQTFLLSVLENFGQSTKFKWRLLPAKWHSIFFSWERASRASRISLHLFKIMMNQTFSTCILMVCLAHHLSASQLTDQFSSFLAKVGGCSADHDHSECPQGREREVPLWGLSDMWAPCLLHLT